MNNQPVVKIAHKDDCNKAFSRKDPTCPRCQELLNGASVRRGWVVCPDNAKSKIR